MKKLNKTVSVISKIAEVALWIGTAMMIVLLIANLTVPDKLGFLLESGEMTVKGFNIEVLDASGKVLSRAVTMIAVAGILLLPMSAMICRNIYLIFKTTEGATFFSKGETPFQADNVRMVREIGIFSIAIEVVGMIIGIIAQLYVGPELAEVSTSTNGIFFGLVILCLSQFFAYGVSLQEEVDGLV